jgi:hypothetical protein
MRNWIQEHILQAITLLGLLFYGGALLTYSNFYAEFGVTPEEAGVDYATALARTIPAFVSWLVGMTIVLGAVAIALLFLWWVIGKRRRTRLRAYVDKLREDWQAKHAAAASEASSEAAAAPAAPPATPAPPAAEEPPQPAGAVDGAEQERKGTDMASLVVGGLALLAVVIFLFEAADKADDLAQRVKDGEEVNPPRLFADPLATRLAFMSNPLRIRVEHVRVFPATPGARMPAGLTTGSTWALLGRSGDVIVLHDISPDREVTVRVPPSQIALRNAG